MRSPIIWFGGKGILANRLVPLIPYHHTYVEVFGGAASVLFAKPPHRSRIEVYNDIDSGLVDFFKVIQCKDSFDQFCWLVSNHPYSREWYYEARATWNDQKDPVKRAYLWFVVARQSFSGHFGAGWSYNVTESSGCMARGASSWLSAIDNLPEIHQRLLRVQIEHNDWRVILNAYDRPLTFFYLDPPYVHSTRSSERYQYELSDDDHHALIETCLSLDGKAMISGYANEAYEPLEVAGWHRIDWQTVCSAAARTRGSGILGEGAATKMQPRIESVWLNYPPPGGEQLQLFGS